MRFVAPALGLALCAAPVLAEVPAVVTDLPPVQSLVAQVMGDLGEPVLLVDQGANAHSFQLRPSQAAALQGASLVVWMGPEMTPWLERALDGLAGADRLTLLDAPATILMDYPAEEAGHDDHEDEEGHDHHGHDPHAWLDPDNAAIWLPLIADALAEKDPEHAAVYAANAAKAQAALATMDRDIAAILAPVAARPAVVFHQAYGYFAAHYALNMPAAIAMGDAAAPGAQHLAAVEAVLAKGPTCLFPEANHDPKLAVQLAEATGAKLGAALDPEGTTLPPGPALYDSLMRGLARNLADCLSD